MLNDKVVRNGYKDWAIASLRSISRRISSFVGFRPLLAKLHEAQAKTRFHTRSRFGPRQLPVFIQCQGNTWSTCTSADDVLRVAEEKRQLRGAFEERLFLETASTDTSSFAMQDYLAPLESGVSYRFADWPASPIDAVAAGVYTIWEGDRFLYVGYAGRGLTAKAIANANQESAKTVGLRDRLDHHASGARGGDQFCAYICDRYVLAALSESERNQIREGDLRLLNARTRKHIRDCYEYRYVQTPDGETARILERAVQGGALKAGKPLLNPR